jgi:hypothetical protein
MQSQRSETLPQLCTLLGLDRHPGSWNRTGTAGQLHDLTMQRAVGITDIQQDGMDVGAEPVQTQSTHPVCSPCPFNTAEIMRWNRTEMAFPRYTELRIKSCEEMLN